MVKDLSQEILRARRKAAEEALKNLIKTGFDLIGIGSGSTVKLFLSIIPQDLLRNKCFVSTSYDTTLALKELGARCVITDMPPEEIDIAIDSADEIDLSGNLLKGGGGALFREKIVLLSARSRVIIADEEKLVERLGKRGSVPIEIAVYAYNYVKRRIEGLGLELKLRSSEGKLGPVISDNGNILADVILKSSAEDLLKLNSVLKSIDGVIATGIFPYENYKILIGRLSGEVICLLNNCD
ncbi:MAG: ribose 5-phosphate isomerase A [Sulfolobales archaeon]